MDEVLDVMRLHHYSIHTERTYCEWIKKYIVFHGMNSRDDLKDGEKKNFKLSEGACKVSYLQFSVVSIQKWPFCPISASVSDFNLTKRKGIWATTCFEAACILVGSFTRETLKDYRNSHPIHETVS